MCTCSSLVASRSVDVSYLELVSTYQADDSFSEQEECWLCRSGD